MQSERIDFLLVSCGSFSPITFMHLRMMEIAKQKVLNEHPGSHIKGVLSPVNDAYGKKGLASSEHRIEMCKLAIQDSDWINVNTWEANQTSNQDTVNVLNVLASFYNLPKEKVLFVCGSDLLLTFAIPGLWSDKDITEIVDHGIVVVRRPSVIGLEEFVATHPLLGERKSQIHICNSDVESTLSSTLIRNNIKENRSIKYLLPLSVEAYIKSQKLFL